MICYDGDDDANDDESVDLLPKVDLEYTYPNDFEGGSRRGEIVQTAIEVLVLLVRAILPLNNMQ